MYKNIEKIIKENINKEVEVIKRFTGGMSNFTYLIKVDKNLYTYRIPGKNSEVFINRDIEYKNIDLINGLNLNCKNEYFNIKNGHKMSLYLEGEDLTNSTVDYNEVATELKKLHNSGIKACNDYIKSDKLDYYESLLSFKNNDEYYELKTKLMSYLNEIDKIEFVFCHGDAQKANWVKSDRLYLLDWEYSGSNDPFYDIACFGNVDFEEAIKLLNAYLGKSPSEQELKRLYVNRMFQCMQWYNVALYKEQIGLSKELNMNFLDISKKYLQLCLDFNLKLKSL